MKRRRSPWRQVFAALVPIVIALAVVVVATRGSSSPQRPFVESIFQDDDHLLYASDATVRRTVGALKELGVDRLRVTILWRAIAPDPASTSPPVGFNASDPGAYPTGTWAPYDRLVALARASGMRVDFDLAAPGPLWAMGGHAPASKYADHWAPSAVAFGRFVAAVGARYSGRYSPAPGAAPLPRVSFWSIWNEPNQPGWLAPQWRTVAGREVMASPVLYRKLADAAFSALRRTGHGRSRDTILIGELAPEGVEGPVYGYRSPIPPMAFLRALYCVDSSYRPLRGAAARVLRCPTMGTPGAFVAANPALFAAGGFAHHPYSFFLAPSASMPDRNFVPLSDLYRLERGLDGIFTTYGVNRKLPLWLTEYGYETYPPNPYRGVPLRLQSLYLNEAQYMAWRDPRVRAFTQFLLYDALPDLRYPPGSQSYWSTFQTGLRFAGGAPKPSLNSYRLPLFLPDPVLHGGRRVLVWAMLRAAPHNSRQTASIEWRLQGARQYRTLVRLTVKNDDEVLVDDVAVPGPGVVRVAWTSPSGRAFYSRGAGIAR